MNKMYKILTFLSVILMGWNSGSFAQVTTFSYTGSVQAWTVPLGVGQVIIQTKGAQGGTNSGGFTALPGNGGCAQATFTVTAGQVLNVYVGGQGTNGVTNTVSPGGFNGGGNGEFVTLSYAGGGGGGASDVRFGGIALSNRMIVAGGGGGAGSGCNFFSGGSGGTLTGENGGPVIPTSCPTFTSPVGGGGGTQTLPGAGGSVTGLGPSGSAGSALGLQGGNGGIGSPGGGGGGGFYGGGGGQYTGGGGGSSFIDPSGSLTSLSRGCNSSGNGSVSITTICLPAVSSVTASSTVICAGGTLTVSDPVAGGTWSSSDVTIATVNSLTGVVTGVYPNGGVATITYNIGPCTGTITVTVNPAPAVITTVTGSAMMVCSGLTAALSDSTSAGTWSSSNTGVATIDPLGTISTVSVGTTTITYLLPTGCYRTNTFTVNPLPAGITGTKVVCVGLSTTLSDLTALGTWSASNTTASVNPGTGVVTGGTAGIDTITYTITATGCIATTTYTVNPLPSPITGTFVVCKGSITTLSDATPSGNWSSSTTTIATVNSTGDVTGVLPGTATITYTITATGCISTAVVTVNPLPTVFTISPNSTVHYCAGGAGVDITLPGSQAGFKYELWFAGSPIVILTGTGGPLDFGTQFAAGTYTILVTDITLSTNCQSSMAGAATIVVDPLPGPITGTTTVCAGSSTTLSDAGGGTWISGTTSVATIGGGTGILTGVLLSKGTSTITYTLPIVPGAIVGCTVTAIATVNPDNPIYGTTVTCLGSPITLFDTADGGIGTWSSIGVSVAGGGTTVTVTGGGSGTVTYTTALGCSSTTGVTFTPLAAITGPNNVCLGLTIALSNINAGGTWTSANTNVATVGTSGIVTGKSAVITGGITTITYTLGTGCYSTYAITVNPLPLPITGPDTVCILSTVTLSDATPGGTWTSASLGSTASVNVSTGDMTGVSPSPDRITYTLTATGCIATYPVTVIALPAAITGTKAFCCGLSTTLSDATAGGWSSGDPAVAVIGAGTGIVTCVSPGTATISYTSTRGACNITTVVTVNPLPAPITGRDTLCGNGYTTALSDISTGGTWTSSNTLIATVDPFGIVTSKPGGGGVITITYTLPTGCIMTQTVLVEPLAPITGPNSVCVGSTIALSNIIGGGTWSSSAVGVGTVDPVTGVVTGISSGSVTIKDSFATGCFTTYVITVNPLPGAITGKLTVCAGSTTTLSDAGGGTWSSGNTNVATVTVGPPGGVVTGVLPGSVPFGTSTITYSLPLTGCMALATVTVYPLGTITSSTGKFSLCQGDIITLSDATVGGTWTTSVSSVATIGSSSGIVTSPPPPPIVGGNTVITFTTAYGCTATKTLTVNVVQNITGTLTVCQGLTTALTDATAGGTWSSGGTQLTVTSPGGVVTGVAPPGAVITYTSPAGCIMVAYVVVNPLPAPITGIFEICQNTTTFLSDATSGGGWTSTLPGIGSIDPVTGLLGGVSGGTTVITYKISSTGCLVTQSVVVDPVAPITGTMSTCVGLTSLLTDVVGGGTWTSSNTTVATVTLGPVGGLVTGKAFGTTTITYTTPKGCQVFTTFTVVPLPVPITGIFTVCQGLPTQLTDGAGGGTWTSSDVTTVTIGLGPVGPGTGVYTGLKGGTSTITYTAGSGCYITQVVTINPITPITGPNQVCVGSTISLTDATAGGTWTSSNTTVATVTIGPVGGGVVFGNNPGTTTITYTLGSGCSATHIVTVNANPNPITGPNVVCVGSTISLTDATGGGNWTVQIGTIASVTAGGVVTGGAGAGADIITYTIPSTLCYATYPITVNPLPAAITGITNVCWGASSTLSDATGGGTWSSTISSVAVIGSTSGVVGTFVGVSGTTTISYTLNLTGCAVTTLFTVSPIPGPITGPTQVCVASSITLSDPLAGGVWTSIPITTAGVTPGPGPGGGIVTGVSGPGVATIVYTTPPGCTATYTVTVVPQPAAIITPLGDTNICPGSFVALTANTGVLLTYQWYSSPGMTLIPGATASSYIAAPAVNTSYQVTIKAGTTGCNATSIPMLVSIIPTTAAISITTGTSTSCAGSSVILTATGTGVITGYQWLDYGTPISGAVAATYSPTVTGDYSCVVTNATGCSATSNVITITIHPSPAGTITLTGPTSICAGDVAVMTADAGAGYTYQWYDGAPIIPGATNVTYSATVTGTYKVAVTNSFGCSKTSGTITITVNAKPSGLSIDSTGPLTFCTGGSVTLKAKPAGLPVTLWQWYKNGAPITGSTGPNLFVAGSGMYKALATNAAGCSDFWTGSQGYPD